MIIKIILGILTGLLIIFVAWMNLTPGHFHTDDCGCYVEYSVINIDPSRPLRVPICVMDLCRRMPWEEGELLMANLDFNK